MTEVEKIAYAKSFIDKLANGINPLDDMPVPDNDIVNNVRLSRCFFYVSDILRQVCEKGGIKKRTRVPKIPFSVSAEQLEQFEYSPTPISASVIAKKINEMANAENMERISYRHITQWLLNIGMLCLVERGERKALKRPTDEGIKIGITVETRMGRYKEYEGVFYNEEAQRFILDNLDAVIATEIKKGKYNKSNTSDVSESENIETEEN